MNLTDKERLRQWTAQTCIIAMICLSITAPLIVLSPSLPDFKVEQLLIPVVVAIYLWLLMAGITRPFRPNGLFLVGVLYFICNTLSIAYGGLVLGHTVIFRDFYEIPKVWLPVAFFTIAYEAELTERALRRLLACFSFAALLVCFYAWGQFIGLGFTYQINSYYAVAGGHIDLALEYARRVYATMGNANVLGALMTWCAVVFVLAALYSIGSRVYYSLVAMACLVTLVMTGSRYAIVSLCFGFLLIFFLMSLGGRRNLSKVAIVLFLPLLAIVTYQAVAARNPRTLERYQALSDPLRVDSLRERLDYLWPLAWADFKKSPLLGHGPGKAFLSVGVRNEGVIDSEYLSTLRERGALGLLVFLSYYIYPLYLIQKGLRAIRSAGDLQRDRFSDKIMILQATFIIGALALIMSVGMATFYTPFLQGFLWLWLGVGAREAKTLRGLAQQPEFWINGERQLLPAYSLGTPVASAKSHQRVPSSGEPRVDETH